MERQGLYKKALEEQEGRIREMERIISLLEEENSLQRQLIERLREEKTVKALAFLLVLMAKYAGCCQN